MALPTWLTWNLQMPRSKKISILCLFATGIVCILFACLRVTQVAINASTPEAAGQPLDPTWLAIWGMVECSIGMSRLKNHYIQSLMFFQLSSLAAAPHSPFFSTLSASIPLTIHAATEDRLMASRTEARGADWSSDLVETTGLQSQSLSKDWRSYTGLARIAARRN